MYDIWSLQLYIVVRHTTYAVHKMYHITNASMFWTCYISIYGYVISDRNKWLTSYGWMWYGMRGSMYAPYQLFDIYIYIYIYIPVHTTYESHLYTRTDTRVWRDIYVIYNNKDIYIYIYICMYIYVYSYVYTRNMAIANWWYIPQMYI